MKDWPKLMEDYQNGQLDSEEQQVVEQKLAEFEAIQEYLWKQEEIDLPKMETPEIDPKKLKKQVNRKFFQLFMSVLVSLLIVLSLVFYVGLLMIEKQYYDPNQAIATGKIPEYTLTQAVYTELTNPLLRLGQSSFQKVGLANYQVTNDYQSKYKKSGAEQTKETYSITRGKTIVNDQKESLVHGHQTIPPFLPEQTEKTRFTEENDEQFRQQIITQLNELPKSSRVEGLLTFKKALPIEDVLATFQKESSETEIQWFSVEIEEPTSQEKAGLLLGIDLYATLPIAMQHREDLTKVNQQYPNLIPGAFQGVREAYTEEDYKTHLISMLTYLIDHPKSLAQLNGSYTVEQLERALFYLKKEGLKINAIYLSASAETFAEQAGQEPVYNINVIDTQLFSEK